MNETPNKDWSNLQDAMQGQPVKGQEIKRQPVEDQTRHQLEALRAELLRNQDPSFQERARGVLNRLKQIVTPKVKLETADPLPFGKIAKGEPKGIPQESIETGKANQ